MKTVNEQDVARFVEERCEVAAGAVEAALDFHQMFLAWCRRNNLRPVRADELVGILRAMHDGAVRREWQGGRQMMVGIQTKVELPF